MDNALPVCVSCARGHEPARVSICIVTLRHRDILQRIRAISIADDIDAGRERESLPLSQFLFSHVSHEQRTKNTFDLHKLIVLFIYINKLALN